MVKTLQSIDIKGFLTVQGEGSRFNVNCKRKGEKSCLEGKIKKKRLHLEI